MLRSGQHRRRLPSPLDPLWFTIDDHAVAELWATAMRPYGIHWNVRVDDLDRPELGEIRSNGHPIPQLRVWRDPCGLRLQDMTVLDIPAGTAPTMAHALSLASSLLALPVGKKAAFAADLEAKLNGPMAAFPGKLPDGLLGTRGSSERSGAFGKRRG